MAAWCQPAAEARADEAGAAGDDDRLLLGAHAGILARRYAVAAATWSCWGSRRETTWETPSPPIVTP